MKGSFFRPGSIYIPLLIVVVTAIGGAGSLSRTTRTLFLGEEKVWIHVYQRSGAELTLINLHDNENTAAAAGHSFVAQHGGHLIELEHGRGREVVVRLNGGLNRFDPNRMFSDQGLISSLKYFHNHSAEVFAYATAFRDTLVELLNAREGMTVIAVHNNTDGKMNIRDFRPGGWYGRDAREVFIAPQRDPDNFFVVIDPALFAALAGRGFNVALRAEEPPDRGMLIDHCARRRARHITVETEHGQLDEQVQMLESLWDVLQQANNTASGP